MILFEDFRGDQRCTDAVLYVGEKHFGHVDVVVEDGPDEEITHDQVIFSSPMLFHPFAVQVCCSPSRTSELLLFSFLVIRVEIQILHMIPNNIAEHIIQSPNIRDLFQFLSAGYLDERSQMSCFDVLEV